MAKNLSMLGRLLEKIRPDPETGCWEWIASKYLNGYGNFSLNGKLTSAHRASYELHKGPIPPGMCVCHHCDNRGCVNPDHLFLGTNAENVADRDAKGRTARHKLTESDVIAIRATVGLTQKELASQFGVSPTLICVIRARKSWSWLPA